MITMSVMHEQMHQRAKQQRQKDERAKQMGAVLHPEVNAADYQEPNENEAGWRPPKAFLGGPVPAGLIVKRCWHFYASSALVQILNGKAL
jgi:hypothetical protein